MFYKKLHCFAVIKNLIHCLCLMFITLRFWNLYIIYSSSGQVALNILIFYFGSNQMFYSSNTRSKDSLHLELFMSNIGKRFIKYKGSLLWNTLHES